MNKWNWFVVQKAYSKLKSIVNDAFDLNNSLFLYFFAGHPVQEM